MFTFVIRNNELTQWVYRLRVLISIVMGYATAWCVKFLILIMAGSPPVIQGLNYVPLVVGAMWGFVTLLIISHDFYFPQEVDVPNS